MPTPALRRPAPVSGAAACLLLLAGCAGQLDHLGRPPGMSPIDDPARQAEAVRVSMPMPAPDVEVRQPASLWQADARGFLRDLRAKTVGDIVTVTIDMTEQAQIRNQTTRSRSSAESLATPNLFGFEDRLGAVFPNGVDPNALVDLGSESSSSGAGSVNRQESIQMRVAAVVTQVLPNGNLVIAGRQEMRVNFELRELRIAGVIRPEDITTRNTVSYEKIAEARIAYGGRGQITDVQQPRIGSQVLDVILPF
ncbi:MAG: flagellar L-ring protein FlgH [Pseudomonadota bacterium]|jgi:flagellar L-ring protein precursor FlgH